MPRSKTVVPGRARRKKVLKSTKGNFSGRRKLYKTALQTSQRAGQQNVALAAGFHAFWGSPRFQCNK